MLTTDERHEIRAFPSSFDSGTKIWKLVSLELPLPYFLVDYAFKQDNAWLSQTSLISSEDVLVELCVQFADHPQRKICQVAMLTPPATRIPSAWNMVTIKEIWEGLHAASEQTALVYFGVDGNRIESQSCTADGCLARLTKLVYAMPESQ